MESVVQFRRRCIKEETAVEGGYVNDKDDLGGETNHGITKTLANNYASQLAESFNWSGRMQDITKPMAFWLYEQVFWHPAKLDEIYNHSPTLAQTMFRWGVKSSVKRPVMSLQETLNCLNNKQLYWEELVVDGIMGTKSLNALKALIEFRGRDNAMAFVVAQTNADQMHYMKKITLIREGEKNERFYWGWNVRCIREVVQYVEKMGLPKL